MKRTTASLLAQLESRLAEHVVGLHETADQLRAYQWQLVPAIHPVHAANRLDKMARELTKVTIPAAKGGE